MLRMMMIGAAAGALLLGTSHALWLNPGVSLGASEARVVTDYYAEKGRCAPGRRGSDCSRSGRRGTNYALGKVLSRKVVVRRLPGELVEELPKLNEGYEYAIVDGDLGILERRTQKLVDVVSLG
ncbi:hypothetical protein [Parvularcula lutaonensis]|uniref:DUF1236 domain-containing protein n=1 Tax=Parvularcula lutaonensis TaxID=491923 RepID=A0ABV7M6W8_9PROT|nr:hypothetical protein [Parvularcula lutaonensis]GGY56455.1 hypothetical protein GCM10007148_27530 [Parvularcula lutaonensis]